MSQEQTQQIVIYSHWISQPSRAVVTLCNIGKIPFQAQNIDILKGEQFKSKFSKLNPDKKVPAMSEGDFILFESHAIMKYLCDSRNLPQHLYPRNNPQQRAKIDQYLDWHHLNTRLHLKKVIFGTMTGKELDVKTYTPQVKLTLQFFENYWLKDGHFINGCKEYSIADLSAYCEIVTLKLIQFDISEYPKINAWMKKIEQIKEIQESHARFNKQLEKMGTKTKPKL